MTYDEIKARFSNRITRDAGDSFQCTCPGHEDNKPSLTVTKGQDGRTVVNCFAGCDAERILAPLGLGVKDLFANGASHRNGTTPQYDPVVATYIYLDEAGKAVCRVQRTQSKRFWQSKPDGRGGWINKMDGVQRVLYRLPDIITSDAKKWVLVVEGEKDVENLRRHGYIATTNIAGAGKPWLDSYSETLRGRKVCILPDNDEPGRKHAENVAAHLVGIAADVRILELPDLPSKGDVTDWLDTGNDPKTLLDLVENTPPFEKPNAEPASKGESPLLSEAIAQALAEEGYTFKMNELADTLEVNGQRIGKGIAAEIRTKMRDRGWSKVQMVEDVYTTIAYHKRFHPVKEYLESLIWDGENHLRKLGEFVKDDHPVIVYPENPHMPVSAFSVFFGRWMIGAVAKVYESGDVKAQNPVLVLDGAQNLGKSSFARWIGSPLRHLMIEAPIKPDNKDHDRYLASMWIWEIAELGATTRKADLEALKEFITKHEVTFRVPYEQHPVTKPALASFIGTINNENGFLNDTTGNRRWMIVRLKSIDWRYLKVIDINQLWAQAYALYKQGEPWTLSPVEVAVRDGRNTEYMIEDPYEAWILKNYEVNAAQPGWKETSSDIALTLQNAGMRGETKSIQMGISNSLKRMGLRQDANARPRAWLGIRMR